MKFATMELRFCLDSGKNGRRAQVEPLGREPFIILSCAQALGISSGVIARFCEKRTYF